MREEYCARSPVVLCVYNRPELTARVFDVVRLVRPPELLVIADGPRSPQDEDDCRAARAVIECVDWDCKIHRNFATQNLGLRDRIASGLIWAFEHCERAIVLEDDCLPHPSFFRFCDELLTRFETDQRVMMISGSRPDLGHGGPPSYCFSHYTLIWGWASWRRAFRYYDPEMRCWPEIRETSFLRKIHCGEVAALTWRKRLDRVFAGHSTWDHQWSLACWRQGGLSAVPSVNLVSNIGFGPSATHCKSLVDRDRLCLPVRPMKFPLVAPRSISADSEFDRLVRERIHRDE
jgi:hypothetical protein